MKKKIKMICLDNRKWPGPFPCEVGKIYDGYKIYACERPMWRLCGDDAHIFSSHRFMEYKHINKNIKVL
jgi:hypothetical protein